MDEQRVLHCWLGTRTMAPSRSACWQCPKDDHAAEGGAMDLTGVSLRCTDPCKQRLPGPALGRAARKRRDPQFCRREGPSSNRSSLGLSSCWPRTVTRSRLLGVQTTQSTFVQSHSLLPTFCGGA